MYLPEAATHSYMEATLGVRHTWDMLKALSPYNKYLPAEMPSHARPYTSPKTCSHLPVCHLMGRAEGS